jgi:hypothetical protein
MQVQASQSGDFLTGKNDSIERRFLTPISIVIGGLQ